MLQWRPLLTAWRKRKVALVGFGHFSGSGEKSKKRGKFSDKRSYNYFTKKVQSLCWKKV